MLHVHTLQSGLISNNKKKQTKTDGISFLQTASMQYKMYAVDCRIQK